MADQSISQADIQSLAQKLSQFTQSLTSGEQAALATVVMRGISQSDDVSGYYLNPKTHPFSQDPPSDSDSDGDFTPVANVVSGFLNIRP